MSINNSQTPNLVFLFILDAVRRDHLGIYGYKRNTSVNIDTLSKHSSVYRWAYSSSSYTHLSVPSILSGKYPPHISNSLFGNRFLKKDFMNLNAIRASGYKTAMFTANIVTSHFQSNLCTFFDYFWDKLTEKDVNRIDRFYQTSKHVFPAVKTFINTHIDKKLFIVVHLMDAHGPYTPHIDSIFKDDSIYRSDKRKIIRVVSDDFSGETLRNLRKNNVSPKYQLLQLINGPDGEIQDFEKRTSEYIAKYDMGIYIMDQELGAFFEFLKRKSLFDNSAIIITSDHGEMMGEEKIFFTHGFFTHPSLISVPLIMKRESQTIQKNIYQAVSGKDTIQLLFNPGLVQKKVPIYSFHPRSYSSVTDNIFKMVLYDDPEYLSYADKTGILSFIRKHGNSKFKITTIKYKKNRKLWKKVSEISSTHYLLFRFLKRKIEILLKKRSKVLYAIKKASGLLWKI